MGTLPVFFSCRNKGKIREVFPIAPIALLPQREFTSILVNADVGLFVNFGKSSEDLMTLFLSGFANSYRFLEKPS